MFLPRVHAFLPPSFPSILCLFMLAAVIIGKLHAARVSECFHLDLFVSQLFDMKVTTEAPPVEQKLTQSIDDMKEHESQQHDKLAEVSYKHALGSLKLKCLIFNF